MISICIPYVRPAKFKRAAFLAKQNAYPFNIEIIAEKDNDRIGCPKMLKKLVEKSKGEFIVFLGDDTLPQPNYLKEAMKVMKTFDNYIGLVGLEDGTGRNLPTHWIAHIDMLDILDGEFFHSGYQHCCCDLELRDRCAEQGLFKMAEKAIVMHDHPMINGSESDEIYDFIYSEPIRSKDRALYEKRKANGWKS